MRILPPHVSCARRVRPFRAAPLVALLAMTCLAQSPSRNTGETHMQPSSVNSTKSKPALQVDLLTDKSSYRFTDPIQIKVFIANCSQSRVYLYSLMDWGESASFSIWLSDAVSGKGLPQTFWGSPPSPPPTSRENFLGLDPDYIYGEMFREKLADFGVHRKGEYLLVAEYHSPVPSSMNFGIPIWSREMGAVSSNTVRIKVTE